MDELVRKLWELVLDIWVILCEITDMVFPFAVLVMLATLIVLEVVR